MRLKEGVWESQVTTITKHCKEEKGDIREAEWESDKAKRDVREKREKGIYWLYYYLRPIENRAEMLPEYTQHQV